MVPHHVELEIVARCIHEERVREAENARQIAAANRSQPGAHRPPSFLAIVGATSRVRWWFRSWATVQGAPADPDTPSCAEEPAATFAMQTIST